VADAGGFHADDKLESVLQFGQHTFEQPTPMMGD
jgi:hypothetical protein